MKSFRQYIFENEESSIEDYDEIARLILSDDPMERYLAIGELSIYDDTEKSKIGQAIVARISRENPEFLRRDRENQQNFGNIILDILDPGQTQSSQKLDYTLLLLFEESGISTDLFDSSTGPFASKFMLKEATGSSSFKNLVDAYSLTADELTSLPQDLLHGLNKLRRIVLKGKSVNKAKVEVISQDLFKENPNLREIEITGFTIEKIEDNIFAYNNELNEIRINKNEILSLNPLMFVSDTSREQNSIETIDFSINRLFDIPTGIFLNLRALKNLILRGNRLKSVPSIFKLSSLDSLEVLDLSYNAIETIEEGVLVDLDSLQELSLAHNQLKEIKRDVLDGLSSLKMLSLSWNNISDIELGAFDKLSKLHSLSLDRAQLQSVDEKVFSPLKNLSVLSIEDSDLSKAKIEMIRAELPAKTSIWDELPF